MNDDLTTYYDRRATEYEAIYAKPERQADLLAATQVLQAIFKEKEVLEIACGTGYWTEKIAQTACSIKATDINESVLEIARHKRYPNQNVAFEVADLYQLNPLRPSEALFGGFLWSHIPLQALPKFIQKTNELVAAGGTVVMMDNRYVEGSSTPIFSRDEMGNTCQRRQLQNGETYLVLKNFPNQTDLENALQGKCSTLQYIQFQYFWIAVWQTNTHTTGHHFCATKTQNAANQ